MLTRLSVRLIPLMLLCFVAGTACDENAPADPPPPPVEIGSWVRHAALPTPRQEILPGLLDGQIYLVGGIRGTSFDDAEVLASVDIYDPATDAWRTAAPLPTPRHHVALAAVGGTLYAFGGFTGRFPADWTALDGVLAYDPGTDSWTPRSPMPHARGEHNAVAFEGRIYVVAGRDPAAAEISEIDIYDPATDTWTSGPPLPTPRHHAATAVLDSLIYVVAGRVIESGALINYATVEAFAPRSGRWYSRAALPVVRGGGVAAAVDGQVVFTGGEAFSPSRVFSSTYVYDPANDAWMSAAAAPVAVHGTGAVTVGDQAYVLGGGVEAGVQAGTANQAFSLD